MATPIPSLLSICIISAIFSPRFVYSSSICPPQSPLLSHVLNSQCPLSVTPSTPLEVNGDDLDRALAQNKKMYTSVLFYAAWCPFSRGTRSTFDALSSIFPQIGHLTVEESSVLPIVFSRYGVRSVPSIIIVNGTFSEHYHGAKDLKSLVQFYKKVTGLEPVYFFDKDQDTSLGSESSFWLWSQSLREILTREPYLVLSLIFLCLRAFIYFFPEMLSRLKDFWVLHIWHPNLGILGEKTQFLEHALHVANIKKVLSKVRLCKTGNFHKGAKNARVWASLASVSLGESSSSRSSPSDS